MQHCGNTFVIYQKSRRDADSMQLRSAWRYHRLITVTVSTPCHQRPLNADCQRLTELCIELDEAVEKCRTQTYYAQAIVETIGCP
jgi:hypothetical protein